MTRENKKKIWIVVGIISILLCGIKLGMYLERAYFSVYLMKPADFEYEVISEEGKTCRLVEYTGSKVAILNIPGEVDGYTVVELGNSLFSKCHDLLGEINIPETVTVIGDSVFYYCDSLSGEIIFPEGLETIGDYAFAECKSLSGMSGGAIRVLNEHGNPVTQYICLPNSIKSIGKYAFAECAGIDEELYLPETLTEIGEGAFIRCTGLRGDLEIPASLTVIPKYAFNECTGLNGSLTMHNGLERILEYAFYECDFKGELEIPDSVELIQDVAFYDAFSGKLILPAGDIDVEEHAFAECNLQP